MSATSHTAPAGTEPRNYLNASSGILSWLLTKDHKRIGILYAIAITFFFTLGGLMAALIRLEAGLKARLRVTQQCRPEDLERTRALYAETDIKAELASFFEDLPEHLAAAHLLIGRAGASTVAEILVVGRPAILVPYPHAIDDHQTRNAHAVDEAGAGWLMPEPTFTPGNLAARLESLLGLPAILEKAAAGAKAAGNADAALRLADVVMGILKSNGADGPNSERRAA